VQVPGRVGHGDLGGELAFFGAAGDAFAGVRHALGRAGEPLEGASVASGAEHQAICRRIRDFRKLRRGRKPMYSWRSLALCTVTAKFDSRALKAPGRSSAESAMQTDHDIDAMARDLREHGFDAEQGARYDFAFAAAKIAAVALLCARHGADEVEMLDALMDSRNLATEAGRLVARIEMAPEFVAYIHSGHDF
jgi:hypothetical protein